MATKLPPANELEASYRSTEDSLLEDDPCDVLDVIVVGNGPSAISLSYLLSGNWPVWNGRSHPDEYLTQRLQQHPNVPIVLQDLDYLCLGLEGRSNNPVSLLFDALQRPDADAPGPATSLLHWQRRPDRKLRHVILGSGAPGGSWQRMSRTVQTLSLCRWMELPNMSFRQWLSEKRRGSCGERALVSDISDYYSEYVTTQGLSENFRSWHRVTSVCRLPVKCESRESPEVDTESGECWCESRSDGFRPPVWEVCGVVETPGQPVREFCLRGRALVLAVGGTDSPNLLDVPGETLPHVHHSLYRIGEVTGSPDTPDPVLVVGAGLSAADCVLHLLAAGRSVIHCFRRAATDPDSVLARLPQRVYPEYRRVLSLMRGEASEARYSARPHSTVHEICADGHVLLRPTDRKSSCCSILVDCVFVLVGAKPDLDFMPKGGRELGQVPGYLIDPTHNPVDADPISFEVLRQPGLYAMGPLVGDRFVRFAQGAALGICADLAVKRGWAEQECCCRKLTALQAEKCCGAIANCPNGCCCLPAEKEELATLKLASAALK